MVEVVKEAVKVVAVLVVVVKVEVRAAEEAKSTARYGLLMHYV